MDDIYQGMSKVVKLDENKLRQIINEVVESILMESITDITYHFTTMKALLNIVTTNEIYMNLSTNSSDAMDDRRLFYLSTQRSRNNMVGFSGAVGPKGTVRLTLNGRKLNQKYSGHAVDYWGPKGGKQSYYNRGGKIDPLQTRFEFEDRIMSYDPVIENALSYILRIDVLLDPDDDMQMKMCRFISYTIDKRCPIYFYENNKDFNNQTNQTINNQVESSRLTYQDIKQPGRWGAKNEKNIILGNILYLMLYREYVLNPQKFEGNPKAYMYQVARELFSRFQLGSHTNEVCKNINVENIKLPNFMYNVAHNMINASNNTPRDLNHRYCDTESNDIMRLGAYVLRCYGEKCFDEVAYKLGHGEVNPETFSTMRNRRNNVRRGQSNTSNPQPVDLSQNEPDFRRR